METARWSTFPSGARMTESFTPPCPACGQPLRIKAADADRRVLFCPCHNRVAVQAWKARNPQKVRAHRKVARAKRAGRLVPMLCEVCGAPNAQAHHDDYRNPLDVRWLCPKHHRAEHLRLRREEKAAR